MSSTPERRAKEPTTYPEAGVKEPEIPTSTPTPTPSSTLSPELVALREKLGTIITDLIFCAQDVGFELAMLKCPDREKCPLVSKTRELIMKVRELFELQREMTKRSR